MGTRVGYRIVLECQTIASLYSNNSHSSENPEVRFSEILKSAKGPTSFLESLLSCRYQTTNGNHRANDRMFHLAPIAEDENIERVVPAHFDPPI